MLAAYHGHADLVKLLIQFGADPNRLNDRGQSPLAGAVFKKEDAVVEVRDHYGVMGSSSSDVRYRHYSREGLIRTTETQVRCRALICSKQRMFGRPSLRQHLVEVRRNLQHNQVRDEA
jgi:hypothetical protein